MCKYNIQDDSGGKINVLRSDGISYCEKNVNTNRYLILNGHRDRGA